MKDQRNLEKAIARMGDLPAMPEVVTEVLRMTQDASTTMADVSEVIQRDPALTAKILRVSNSSYYGMRQHVGTVKLALVILGVRELRNIVLGISVFEALRTDKTGELLSRDFWRHSVMVAALAKKLGSALQLGFLGEDFIAGLLHDIGKMVLWRQLGDQYVDIFEESGGASEALCALEEDRLSFTHADAGAALAEHWNLPKTLSDALWYHHTYDGTVLADAKDPSLSALVCVANLAARDDFSSEAGRAPRACAETEDVWRHLETAPAPIEAEARQETLAQFVMELAESPIPPL